MHMDSCRSGSILCGWMAWHTSDSASTRADVLQTLPPWTGTSWCATANSSWASTRMPTRRTSVVGKCQSALHACVVVTAVTADFLEPLIWQACLYCCTSHTTVDCVAPCKACVHSVQKWMSWKGTFGQETGRIVERALQGIFTQPPPPP